MSDSWERTQSVMHVHSNRPAGCCRLIFYTNETGDLPRYVNVTNNTYKNAGQLGVWPEVTLGGGQQTMFIESVCCEGFPQFRIRHNDEVMSLNTVEDQ